MKLMLESLAVYACAPLGLSITPHQVGKCASTQTQNASNRAHSRAHDADVVQTSSQPLSQPLFAGMPAPRRSTDEERNVQQPGASAPFYSLQPPQEVTRNSLWSLQNQRIAWRWGTCQVKPVRRCQVRQLVVHEEGCFTGLGV